MSLTLALDLPNQTTNLSLGLITSVEAREARSLLATDPAGLSTGDLDPYYYNLGTDVRAAILAPATYSQSELARAVCFAKGVGTYSLSAGDFDSGSLLWAQEVAPFFKYAFVVRAVDFVAAFDTTAGNTGGATGSWTTVNADVDVRLLGSTPVVGWSVATEWLEYALPALAQGKTFRVFVSQASGFPTPSLGTLAAGASTTSVSFVSPQSWDNLVESESTLGTFSVPAGTSVFRLTKDSEWDFSQIRFVEN